MIIIWHASTAPNQAAYGSDAEEVQFEKEYWRPRTTFKYVYSSFAMCPGAANGYLTRIARRYATSRIGDSRLSDNLGLGNRRRRHVVLLGFERSLLLYELFLPWI